MASPDSSERAARALGFHRFRQLDDRVLLTSQEGSWLIVSKDEFTSLQRGELGELEARLLEANLLERPERADVAASALAKRRPFLAYGPNLHILIVTLRCNETCAYCHASRAAESDLSSDMSFETAERSVDLALASTSPDITIEFQGGEPLLRFDLLKHIVAYALEKNQQAKKTLEFALVSNLATMDDEKLEWLCAHRVQVCTSVDGPAEVHDAQRKLVGGSAHAETVKWIKRINGAYEEAGLDANTYRVEALLTTTKRTLAYPREVVDTYLELGCRALFLRPLDPFGFASKTAAQLAYPMEDFLEFYKTAVDYMLEKNRQGEEILERFAGIFLTKILSGQDPNYLDIRSPCGAGIGQVAYGYDGRIFTCDEGRMLSEEGDDTFLIGDVKSSSYRELMGHETVRTLAVASNLDGQPQCSRCAYQPYCGVCPVHNHKTQGTLFGRTAESTLCKVHMGIQDFLFRKLDEADPAVMDAFAKWTTVRPRDHYLHRADD